MNWLDVIFVVFLCTAAGLGFMTGFVWQIYGLFCLVLSYFAALLLYDSVSRPFEEGLGPGTAKTVGYASVFGAVFIISYGLGVLIRSLLCLRPGVIGRVLGALLGFCQAALVCGVVAVVLADYSSGSVGQMAESSRVVTAFAKGARFLTVIIPGDIKGGVETVKEKSRAAVEAAREKMGNVKLEDVKEGIKAAKDRSEEVIKSAAEKIEGGKTEGEGGGAQKGK